MHAMPERETAYACRRSGHLVSTDPSLLDLDAVERFLRDSYWAPDRPRHTIERSVAASLPFGLYRDDAGALTQVGFARVITDRATFAWLCDVYVAETARGAGLGTWLVACVLEHPDLRELKRILLATRDAHGLYAKLGFGPLAAPDRWMERRRDEPRG